MFYIVYASKSKKYISYKFFFFGQMQKKHAGSTYVFPATSKRLFGVA